MYLARAATSRARFAGDRRDVRAGEPLQTEGRVANDTKRAVAVNGVYTPPEWRRRGYATACVAELSERLLEQGFEFCVLYTDLENPTSNGIYTRIGYRPVRDFLMYALPG